MINDLLRGASLLSCGGGLKFSEQKKLARGKKLTLIKADKLNAKDWGVTISEMGASDAPVMDKTLLPQAIKLLEAKTGKKIKALIPPEIGQEAIVIDAAAVCKLPVVDTDLAGCRAVPRLSDSALIKKGINFTMSPLVLFNAAGKMLFVNKQKNLFADEAKARQLIPKNQVVTLVGGLLPASIIQSKLNFGSYTLAAKLGSILTQKGQLKKAFPTKILLGPVTVAVNKIIPQSLSGFDSKIVTVSIGSREGSLRVQNEYMHLSLPGQSFAFPQLTMIFDPKFKRGIHSSELAVGSSYQLMVAEAFKL